MDEGFIHSVRSQLPIRGKHSDHRAAVEALDERLLKALIDLLPRFRRRFPAIQDEVEITEVFEEAVRRIQKRERQAGPIEKLRGYAWKALESIGVSVHRRSTMQIRVKRVESRTGPEIVSRLRALDGSVEQIERDILLREIEVDSHT